MNVIETANLTKTYRRFEKEPGLRGSIKSLFKRKYLEKTAVNDFNITVEEGEFVGLIGPNGAGKTTLVKILTGIIAPTSGEISVLGHYPNKLENDFKRQYAVVMGQRSQLFFELTPEDTFRLFKELYGIPEDVYRKNVSYLVELFEAAPFLRVQVRTLSLGERMKMELIVALLHEPRVLFLDEPTIGLDAVAQKQIRSFLRQVNDEKGVTILLTSHYMEDIKSLCRRCVVINGGERLYDGKTDALFTQYQTHKRITFTHPEDAVPVFPTECRLLEHGSGKTSILVPKEQSSAVLRLLLKGRELGDVTVEEDDIGNVVERIYNDKRGGSVVAEVS